MSKRDIQRAATRAGIKIVEAVWEWVPTPGENVPVWSVQFDDDDCDRLGISAYHEFANTHEAVGFIDELKEQP